MSIIDLGNVTPKCSKCGSSVLDWAGDITSESKLTCHDCGHVDDLENSISSADFEGIKERAMQAAIKVAKDTFKF